MSQDIDRKAEFESQVVEEAKALGLIEAEEVRAEESPKTEKVREYTEVEKEQMELGWDPNKTGPTAVSAEEYKRVGQIIEAKRAASKKAEAASKEVQELTMTVKQLVEHNRKLEKANYAKEIAAIDAQRDELIAIGDVQGVKELAIRERVLIEAQKGLDAQPVTPVTPVQQELSEEVKAYTNRNKEWLNGTTTEDLAMQKEVKGVINYLKEVSPDIDELGAIKAIEDRVKERFPHRFENPNKEKPAAVARSVKGSGVPKGSYDFADLSREEQHQFLAIQRADETYTLKEYTELLKSVGRRE